MSYQELDIEQTKNLLSEQECVIADIRDPHSFSEGHIKGSKNVTDENIESFVNDADKAKPLVCVCFHGFSSQNAAAYFVDQGFERVYSLEGGFEQWKQDEPFVKSHE